MSARAIWKGAVVLAKTRVPVRLLSAVQERDVHFRLLHAKDHAPVRQSMVHPETGEEVPREQIRKGYEAEPGVFVVFSKEELDAVEPPQSPDMEVVQAVPRGTVGSYWYERPYWLAADTGAAADYAALAAALVGAGSDAIVRWVMRSQTRVAVLRAHDGHLLLVALRQADEVVPPERLEAPLGAAPDARELRLGEQLVSALEGRFEPARHQNDYQGRVRKLIEAKAKGRRLPCPPAARRKPAPASLARALEASLRSVPKERKRA